MEFRKVLISPKSFMHFEQFLKILEDHYKGVLLLLLCILTFFYILNWLARIFNWGRYKHTEASYVRDRDRLFADFLARLINDFRHLLALVIVVVFVSLIFYSMSMTDVFDQKMDALQLVIASLGGLLGSIIGYYFGESAVRKAQANLPSQSSGESNIPETEIFEVPPPKGLHVDDPKPET